MWEGLMLICFGVSWPPAIIKTLRVKNPAGKSFIFMMLVLTGYYLNNLYPDRILMEEGAIGIKLFLFNDWFTYKPEQVQYQRTERCVYLYIAGKKRYRLSLEKLSVRLYMQITEMLKPYRETINK